VHQELWHIERPDRIREAEFVNLARVAATVPSEEK